MADVLERDPILAGLSDAARAAISRLEIHAILDSTNSYLLAGAQAGWPSGVVCLAEQQHAGRGRRGRAWLTPFAAGLALSLLWRFSVPATALSGLSLATGIAVARTLEAIGVEGVGLKWPNDVWWRQRKLGGILLESSLLNGDFHVVAGIGLNVDLPPAPAAAIDQPWVDLREICGAALPSRNRLAALLISNLCETFLRFAQGGFADLTQDWARFDRIAGQPVRLYLPQGSVTGIARGVDASGALLLEGADGRLIPYLGGEVSVRIEA